MGKHAAFIRHWSNFKFNTRRRSAMKKLVTLLSLIAVLGLLLAACGAPATATSAPATEAPTEAAATEAPATEAPSDASATLTLWVYDDGRLEVLKELGEKFEAEYGVALNV